MSYTKYSFLLIWRTSTTIWKHPKPFRHLFQRRCETKTHENVSQNEGRSLRKDRHKFKVDICCSQELSRALHALPDTSNMVPRAVQEPSKRAWRCVFEAHRLKTWFVTHILNKITTFAFPNHPQKQSQTIPNHSKTLSKQDSKGQLFKIKCCSLRHA